MTVTGDPIGPEYMHDGRVGGHDLLYELLEHHKSDVRKAASAIHQQARAQALRDVAAMAEEAYLHEETPTGNIPEYRVGWLEAWDAMRRRVEGMLDE